VTPMWRASFASAAAQRWTGNYGRNSLVLLSKVERLSFSGHETFPFRYMWLRKSVDAVAKDHDALLSDDAMISLGVGKNMVRAIRHWGLASGVLEEFGETRVKK